MIRSLLLASLLFLVATEAAYALETIGDRCTADLDCTLGFYEPLKSNHPDDSYPSLNQGFQGTGKWVPTDGSGTTIEYSPGPWNPGEPGQSVIGTVLVQGGSNSPNVSLTGRSYVAYMSGRGNQGRFHAPGDTDHSLENKARVCSVHYEHIEGDWRVGSSCPGDWRHKIHSYHPNGGPNGGRQWQITASTGAGSGGSCPYVAYGANHNMGEWSGSDRTIRTNEVAKTDWMRIESCFYSDDEEGLSSGQKIGAMARYTWLNVGAEERVYWGPLDGQPYATTGGGSTWRSGGLHGISLDRQGGAADNKRYFTAAATMWWPVNDNNDWPGPECDIEPNHPDCGSCTSDPECDDSNPCTDDTCNVDTCAYTPNTEACNDTFSCTTDDTCDGAGDCVGTPVDANCDDSLYCNGDETCDVATGDPVTGCNAGTPVVCDDSVPCTDDSCNEGTDSCDFVENDANCDDSVFCNGAETCDDVLDCQAGTPPTCDDSVDCTDDSCNVGTDSCDNIVDDSNCDDGLFCNGDETCDAVLDCQAGSDPCPGQGCDDFSNSCTEAPAGMDPDSMNPLMSSQGGSSKRGPIKDGYVGYIDFSMDKSSDVIRVDATQADVCLLPDTLTTGGSATVSIRRIISAETEAGSEGYITLSDYDCESIPFGEYYLIVDHTNGSGRVSVSGR